MQVEGDAPNKASKYEKQPFWLVVAEELSHALADFDGVAGANVYEAKDDDKDVNTYIGVDGQGHAETYPTEELENHGIGNYSRPASSKRSSYPNENAIRKEHGLKKRVAYDVFSGQSDAVPPPKRRRH